ncbi:MAG: DUF1566 domain-containing protein, partial [Lentisphaeria bacterium]|nr:DUF1566 domain-containing protein [Lentisphaeria bacterium]
SQGDGNYAAKLCQDLDLNGYDDWFLPSKYELLELYSAHHNVGWFGSGYFWSSTEDGANSASGQDMFDGDMYSWGKHVENRVRAIREF